MAGLFSPSTLERIRAANEIVEVIGSYVPLKRAGGAFVGLCPFHREKTPSFHVNPQRQTFHCFGCHKGGDVFTFLKEFENLDFPEAVRRLAERAKIPLEYQDGAEPSQSRHLKDQLLQIHEQLAQRWHNALLNEASGQAARDYLDSRRVPLEAVTLFRLGAAPEAWDDTVNWARSRDFDLAIVEKAGLIIRKEGSDRYYDRFRGRLMFPICDEQGRVIGFSGRVLAADAKTAKYVNSPETPIFTKSKVFFGLDKAKRAILDAGHAVVCEGQLDLITCHMAEVRNVVAPQGTAFTGDHARILKRYVEEVVLCFDSDEAGQNATVRSLDHLLASGLAVRVAVVPRPHDPDSYIKEAGAEKFRELIQNAQGFFDYYLGRLVATNDLTTDKGRLALLHAMAEAVLKTGNDVLTDKYAQLTALRLGVSPESVRGEFRKAARNQHRAQPNPEIPQPEPEGVETETAQEISPPSPQEFWLLKLLLSYDDLVPWAAMHLDLEWLQHPHITQIIAARLRECQEETWTSLPAFMAKFEDAGILSLITESTIDARVLPNPPQQLADVTLRIRNQFLDRRLAALLHQASQPETSDADRDALLREQVQLRAQKRERLPLPEPGV